MSDTMLSSAPGPMGNPSPRKYTKAEFAAAKRLGFANGRISAPSGPIFWASGEHYPNLIREQLADYELVAAAVAREWDKPWKVATEGENDEH